MFTLLFEVYEQRTQISYDLENILEIPYKQELKIKARLRNFTTVIRSLNRVELVIVLILPKVTCDSGEGPDTFQQVLSVHVNTLQATWATSGTPQSFGEMSALAVAGIKGGNYSAATSSRSPMGPSATQEHVQSLTLCMGKQLFYFLYKPVSSTLDRFSLCTAPPYATAQVLMKPSRSSRQHCLAYV